MPMTFVPDASRRPHAVAAAFSACMLAGAVAFQHLGDVAPCHLCMSQRWAHVAAFCTAVATAALPGRGRHVGGIAAGLILISGAGLAGYHVGVENHWWATSCAVDLYGAGSVADFRERLMSAPITRCDEITWSMLGISMAGWNGILSLVTGVAAMALGLKASRRPASA